MKISIEEELKRQEEMWLFEKEMKENGYSLVCGIDEAGRGPLAGPVYAACVILPECCVINGINDSKKLSEKKRELLFDEITQKALDYNIASVDEKIIDEINILNATHLAMNDAIEGMKIKPDFALIDGNSIKNMKTPHQTIVKGDAKSISIAAASILAKVARDRYITEISDKYPQYEFAKHKGYGTKLHTDLLKQYGPCEIHRRTFLTKILGEKL